MTFSFVKASIIMSLFMSFICLTSSFAESLNYVYDDLNRLTRVEFADGTALTYDYDEIGNRVQKYIKPTACANLPIKLGGAYYSILQTTYNTASDGSTVQAMYMGFDESLDFNREITITLDGGYGCDYSTNPDYTTVNGPLTITNGSVTLGNIIVR